MSSNFSRIATYQNASLRNLTARSFQLAKSCEADADRGVYSCCQILSRDRSANVVDNMVQLMERYSNHLEEMVEEKTTQVADEKRKSELLLYRMLPV
jgi:hypothetical protein